MRKIYLFILFVLGVQNIFAQQIYKITYRYFRDSTLTQQDPIIVFANSEQAVVTRQSILEGNPRFSYEESFVNYKKQTILRRSTLSDQKSIATIDNQAYNRYAFEKENDSKKILNYNAKKAKTSVNSNSIEIWYTEDLGIFAAPNDLGFPLGLVLEYRRNGNTGLIATKIEKIKNFPKELSFPNENEAVDLLTYRDILWKSKFIQIPIFNNERIRFEPGIKSDSVMRFAEGTVVMKKIIVPEINYDAQAFIQLIEKSSGDAYDRTGSVFLIADDQQVSFLDGMQQGMKTLPRYDAGDGKDYLGMVRTNGFSPIYELMRFFTPFGVAHFNKNLTLKDKVWQDSVIYRQDISEFLHALSGKEVYIGTYIGNYDKGGHTISLELTIHPGNSNYGQNTRSLSLFNTTNVMEMGGQTYATLFEHERGLEFEFELKEDIQNARLRYITTGHGGWWNGDEFVPKENTIFLNDVQAFSFTPWRVDCGSYRLYNPVSGNFDSGLSSSDLSRSNWCPGTITYPNYINLGNLKAGKHKIRVKIPQGPREGESFSFWNVSGALLFDK